MADHIVEPHILEAYLFYTPLEVLVVKDLESVSINKQHSLSFNLSMT